MEKVTIIGSGPAGFTAALYAARANLAPFMLEGFLSGGSPGGQLMTTTEVENYPGFPGGGISGPALMDKFREQAKEFGTTCHQEDVTEVDLSARPFKVKTDEREVETHSLIISTGATAKRLHVPSEERLWSRGMSACAVCDGALPAFRNKDLAVIGGGDSAVEEGTFLTKFASRVYIVHRREELRASKIMQKRALENEQRLARSGGGVSACALCDGAQPVLRDKVLLVVGGGDNAVEEATYLTKFASRVYIVHRRD